MRYEIFYLIGASKEAELEKIRGEVKELISSLGGIFEEKETLEKRKMAYRIRKETHGIYTAQRFELPEIKNIHEISRKLNLNNELIRFLISRADELPELKSKEERIQEAEGKKTIPENKKESAPKKEKQPEKSGDSPQKEESRKEGSTLDASVSDTDNEKKVTKLEDIDDKLEEILNI